MTRKRIFLASGLVLLLGAGVAAAQVYVPGGGLYARLQQREQAFIDSLALDADQTAAWQTLSRQRMEFRLGVRMDFVATKERAKSELANPNANLHALVEGIHQTVDHDVARHRALQQAQLAFYDTLDADQQSKVRARLLDRIERFEGIRDNLLEIATALQE